MPVKQAPDDYKNMYIRAQYDVVLVHIRSSIAWPMIHRKNMRISPAMAEPAEMTATVATSSPSHSLMNKY
jgi:hypothetical protein